jgi:hypothetical protein
MSKFTKGQWQIMPYTRRDGDNIRWVKAVRGKRHIPICQTFSPCAESHARLIATAPDLQEALDQSKEIFSKKLRLIRAKECKAKHDFSFIESRYWSGVYNNIFELRQEIERMLDKLKLNKFCILMAFMPEEKKEVAKAKKEG